MHNTLILTGMWRMSRRRISLNLVLISKICSETFNVCFLRSCRVIWGRDLYIQNKEQVILDVFVSIGLKCSTHIIVVNGLTVIL